MNRAKIKEFIDQLKANPFKGNQESCGTGIHLWTADMWTMEIAQCLYNKDNYTPPGAYNDNHKFSLPRILHDTQVKLDTYDSLKEIVALYKDPNSLNLLVCEVGRGLDILMANMVNNWNHIYCYDHVDYASYLAFLGDNISFKRDNSSIFNPQTIKADLIMVMNHSIVKPFNTPNIKHKIINGKREN